ncbi:MAG TPA: glycosyltransferase family 2 protein [Vineibacter sp.]|nr:glycosyltransferase family 2 protein [Vineibacter sp.]
MAAVIFPFPSTSVIGAKRVGLSTWRATNDEPRFVFSFRLLRPQYCVLVLTPLDGPLRPMLHFDHGADFDHGDFEELAKGGTGVYVVSLADLQSVKRVRLQLATRPTRFRLSAWATYGGLGIGLIMSRAIARAERAGGPEPTFEFVGHSDRRGDLLPGKFVSRRFRGFTAHYANVLTIAAMTPARAAPSPGPDSAPFISFVVPVFNTPKRYLDDLLASFRLQPAGVAELVLSDDGSTAAETAAWLSARGDTPGVTVVRNAQNQGIAVATNAAIAAARGTWVGLVDHDDALSRFAVARVVDALQKHPDAKFLFTDEVITDGALNPVRYHLKPAYDPVLLSGVNYLNHLSLYRRDRLRQIGGLRQGFEGSQDYDLALRYLAGLRPEEVIHLPYPAYLWRRHEGSLSTKSLDQALQSARRALSAGYSTPDATLRVEEANTASLHRIRFDMGMKSWPRVSIVIPSRDQYELISRLIDDLEKKTDYPEFEIIVVDNGTTDARVLALYDETRERIPGFRAEIRPEPFNFARQVNRGISLSSGDYVLLLNNDIEVIAADWLREMVSCFSYSRVGVVGARLLYPDMTLQHAGVIVGMAGLAAHWFLRSPKDSPGEMGRLNVRQSLTAVTGACMLISRSCLDEVGAFDEEVFAVAYNDVDYCLRAVNRGYRVVWTPFATLIHHESVSRGSDETDANRPRFDREKAALRQRHKTDGYLDRAYSPWYGRDHAEPRVVMLNRLPEPR